MNLAGRKMQWQLALICLSGLLMAALSVFLISDAVRGAEQIVLGDAGKAAGAAADELLLQGAERAGQEPDWAALAMEHKDVSLRGVSQAVLRSYPDVEGGYCDGREWLGYSFPTHVNPERKTDVPTAEADEIRQTAAAALATGSAQRVLHGRGQAVVIAARAQVKGALAAWAMKRVNGLDAQTQQRRLWLVALVSAALLSLLATLATAAGLARGVSRIKSGLTLLERDYHQRVPELAGELGDIARAINRMVVGREALERELRREDRLRAMGRLVAAVAHEVRNPLNGMRLTAQLLQRQLAQDRQSAAQLDSIIAEIDRLEELVREFLVFDRDQAPHLVEQAVLPAVERTAKLLAAQAARQRVAISVDGRNGERTAHYDTGRLTQVLMNLLLNAIESQAAGGWIRTGVRGGERVEVYVADGGPGVPAKKQERLFEMFYSQKPDGAGLGLAVSRELMRQMGGDLTYDTEQEHACFVIRMPSTTHGE